MAYTFDPDDLHAIARRAVGLPFDEMVATVIGELDKAYPGHIDMTPEWLFTTSAGFKGSMAVLYASMSEYLMIFGNPIGTSGFSGRHLVEFHDTMLAGEMWSYTEENPGTKVVSSPGDRLFLARGKGKMFTIPDGAWMLEYARGPIATSLPLALADATLSCGDFPSVGKTFRVYSKLTLRALRNRRRRETAPGT